MSTTTTTTGARVTDALRARMVEFAAQRDAELTNADGDLEPLVREALERMYSGDDDWWDDLVAGAEVLWLETYDQVPGAPEPTIADITAFGSELGDQLANTSDRYGSVTDSQAETVTRWVSTYTVNNATSTAATGAGADVAWVTMHDDDVRPSHRALDGEIRPVGGTFEVDGHRMQYPGQPVGPPDTWINCRCVLLPLEAQMTAAATVAAPTTTPPPQVSESVATTAAAEPEADPDASAGEPTEGYDQLDVNVPWHGVIAPTGVHSGDRREFGADSLRFRDMPLPLRWQKADAEGHEGSVVIGNITEVFVEEGLIKASGTFASNAEAGEVITLIAEGMLRGVSVDLEPDATFDLVDDDGNPFDVEAYSPGDPRPITRITDARVTSAAVVPIPAFQEAFVRLGSWPTEVEQEQQAETLTAAGGCVPCAASEMDGYYENLQGFAISEASWDGAASRFDDDQWKRSTVVDRGESFETAKERYAVPIREPNGDLSRAAVHNAAARIDQVDAPAEAIAAGKRKLVAAYRQLDETPPESLVASARSWVGVFAAEAPTDESDDPAESEQVEVKVGDTVTWTSPAEADGEIEEHTGEVTAIDGDMATVTEGDDTFEVPVADLTVVPADDEQSEPVPGEEEMQFAPGTHDGPGWVTNPDDTQRLRTYWTRGAGAAKIRWGQPGDFNRCRTQLAKYITNPHYLAGTCANMHKVALGIWPGEHASDSLVADAAPAFRFAASTIRAAVPGAWLADPQFTEVTPLSVDWDGELDLWRVRGHLATWGTCHIGLGLSVGDGTECVTPPSSPSNYAYFRTDAVRTAEGDLVPVGHITLGTGHAPASMANRPAAAHYDNTGTVVADVTAGEDEYGIWVAGVLRPGADPDVLQAASLSGDWRTIAGRYELVAALGVNVPGFPIPRMAIGASAGGTTSLVAAGVVIPAGEKFTFDATTLAKDVYNETMAIGRRASRRRHLSARMRAMRRAQLTARLSGGGH